MELFQEENMGPDHRCRDGTMWNQYPQHSRLHSAGGGWVPPGGAGTKQCGAKTNQKQAVGAPFMDLLQEENMGPDQRYRDGTMWNQNRV